MIERVKRLQQKLQATNLDAILITSPSNRRYLSGFTGTAGAVLIALDSQKFITDFRYIDQANAQCVGFEVVREGTSLIASLEDQLRRLDVKRIGFEGDYVPYTQALEYQDLESRVEGLSFVPVSGLVEALRVTKDETEIEAIRRAAHIADSAFEHILGQLRPGLTELDVALEMDTFMKRLGSSDSAFRMIVASGWRSALPHGTATSKQLEAGDLVTFDFGATVDGYISDLTRTVVLGQPTAEQKKIYQIVLDAQLKALDALAAGKACGQLDEVARLHIAEHGYGEAFGHSLGHGIGLDVHELPRLRKGNLDLLKPSMVVTIEPGIYLPGWGGVRIEDDVVIETDGIRVLTHAPKHELIVV